MNVLIFRYDPEKPLFSKRLLGRSHCSHCHRQLSWYELFPIFSFIFLGARCRTCKKPISIQYPLIELASGIVFATLPVIFNFQWPGFLWAIALLILIVLSVVDLKYLVIPDEAHIGLIAIGSALIFGYVTKKIDPFSFVPGSFLKNYADVFSFTHNPIISHLSAGLIIAALFALIVIISRGKAMGWGDVKLAFSVGILLGFPDVVLAVMIAYVIGAIVGVWLISTKKKKMKDVIPFGPFIALGATIVIYFGYPIVDAYLKFLSSL